MNSVRNKINSILSNKIDNEFNNDVVFMDALGVLLGDNFSKYNLNNKLASVNYSGEDFQKVLFNINEKSSKQKKNGVFYTPNDVSNYIIANTFINYLDPAMDKTINVDDFYAVINMLDLEEIKKLLFKTKILDPTCGSGEFLLNAFIIKFNILSNFGLVTDANILKLIKTIAGNDIDDESTDISKIRLFFYVAKMFKNKNYYAKVAQILLANFTNYDFIGSYKELNKKYDLIIGNPPYVEYGKVENKSVLTRNYGNIYADIIENSIELLNQGGTLGFIIPLSYVATSRMAKIRDYVDSKCNKQIILSFADRPDCLFKGVHQKLNIIIFRKEQGERKVYVSNYKHWYKEERPKLLDNIAIYPSSNNYNFIPKIGNKTEKSIFNKVYTDGFDNLLNFQSQDSDALYLNMRCCFWIKAFSFNPGSNEYKAFYFINNDYVICLLNSSLFWLFWIITSDCWHITTKELKTFKYIATTEDFSALRQELEQKLEDTKKYIGTVQTAYEYKHKYCKDVIDKIDDKIASIYKLNKTELKYIKNFAMKYRVGGLDDDNKYN